MSEIPPDMEECLYQYRTKAGMVAFLRSLNRESDKNLLATYEQEVEHRFLFLVRCGVSVQELRDIEANVGYQRIKV